MKKPYTAEAQVRGTETQFGAYPPPISGETDGMVLGEELFELLSDIRQEVRDLRASIGTGAVQQEPSSGDAGSGQTILSFPNATGGGDEVQVVLTEIARMASSLGRAKLEIAAIRHPDAEDKDCVDEAASELDEIVKATENATSTILDASESIGHSADRIRQLAGYDEELSEIADKIGDHAMTILEACNFQDLTGQRITKVVQTLEFIADRIKAIIAAWGLDAFKGVPLPEKLQVHSEDELVEGPQLDGGGISQDEIDALFD